MTHTEKYTKRLFDIFLSFIGLVIFGWIILLIICLSWVFIGGRGVFKQTRIGQYGESFTIYKIETIHPKALDNENYIITNFGLFIRKYKLDEWPQLLNILEGKMSFVGPRPDIPGYADELQGEERVILSVKPGITGPATLYFRNEESLLKTQKNRNHYNKQVVWPQKVAMNIKYVKEYSFKKDLYYIYKTLFFNYE